MKTNPDFSMTLNSLKKIITDWLEENLPRFNHPPYLIKIKDHCLIFQFIGVATKIQLVVQKRGNFEIPVTYRNRFWDFVHDFDVAPAITKSGRYYCKLCLPPGRKYYGSLTDLVRRESLEPLLNWANETFQEDKWIALFQIRGCTWVEIVEVGNIPIVKRREEYVTAFPLVQAKDPKNKRSFKP